jgi:hypothetical protein
MPTLGYDAVLAVVVVELVVAFAIGISCILFSFNLFRELSSDELEVDLRGGDLPSRSTMVKSPMMRSPPTNTSEYNTFERDSDVGGPVVDPEDALAAHEAKNESEDAGPQPHIAFVILNSFFDYIRI